MTIIEALTLAREEKKRVRPVCWLRSYYLKWDDEEGMFCVCVHPIGRLVSQEGLRSASELLGEWEVVYG